MIKNISNSDIPPLPTPRRGSQVSTISFLNFSLIGNKMTQLIILSLQIEHGMPQCDSKTTHHNKKTTGNLRNIWNYYENAFYFINISIMHCSMLQKKQSKIESVANGILCFKRISFRKCYLFFFVL